MGVINFAMFEDSLEHIVRGAEYTNCGPSRVNFDCGVPTYSFANYDELASI